MKKNPEAKAKNPLTKKQKTLIAVVAALAVILAGLLVTVLILSGRSEEPAPTVPPTEAPTVATEAPTAAPTEPPTEGPTEPQPIEWMVKLYEENPDIVYWMKIEGTNLDNPVMYTPD